MHLLQDVALHASKLLSMPEGSISGQQSNSALQQSHAVCLRRCSKGMTCNGYGCDRRAHPQVAHGDSDVDAASRALAQRTWPALKRSTKAGVRRTVRHPQQGAGFGACASPAHLAR